MGLFKYLYVHHAASHVYIIIVIKKKVGGFVLSFNLGPTLRYFRMTFTSTDLYFFAVLGLFLGFSFFFFLPTVGDLAGFRNYRAYFFFFLRGCLWWH